MDIVTRIAKNLSAWMLAHKTLSTLEAVVDKSGVGYGTVRRIKKGEINATIENLERIASAFDRSVADLIADPGDTVLQPAAATHLPGVALPAPVQQESEQRDVGEL